MNTSSTATIAHVFRDIFSDVGYTIVITRFICCGKRNEHANDFRSMSVSQRGNCSPPSQR